MFRLFSTQLLLFYLLAGLAGSAWAVPLPVDNLPAQWKAGQFTQVLRESDQPLELTEAVDMFRLGKGSAGAAPILTFGIGGNPVWLKLPLSNSTDGAIPVRVITGITWVDQLELWLQQSDRTLAHWQGGDTHAGADNLIPGIGFVTSLQIPPGKSELYVRAESPDPLVMPIEVLTEEAFSARQLEYRFVYGLIYGFLLSMIVYNCMLFIGMRNSGYLIYSAYLSLFTLLNLTYTGHGFVWFWPGNPVLQNHVILVTMLLFGCLGLVFANKFLALSRHAPRAFFWLQGLASIGIAALGLSLLMGRQDLEALVAFSFTLIAPLSMVLVGLLTLKQHRLAGQLYLAATVVGALGLAISTLTVWGKIPFSGWTYGAIKIGLMLQAPLMALALSIQFRHQQSDKLQAERLAQCDPLTGLHNRRGFNEHAATIWSTALRNRRPLSLIMLDLDHFKQLNDRHGHAAGDLALEQTARLLERACRSGDLLARWGGEEFLLLLPETGLAEAYALAERLRQQVQALSLSAQGMSISLGASFGVIERTTQEQLEQLINQADRLLYQAKSAGRNQVICDA